MNITGDRGFLNTFVESHVKVANTVSKSATDVHKRFTKDKRVAIRE